MAKKKESSRNKSMRATSKSNPAGKAKTNSKSKIKKKAKASRTSRSARTTSGRKKIVEPSSLAAELLYGPDDEFRQVNQRTNVHERIVERAEMSSEFQLRYSELRQQYQQAEIAMVKIDKWVQQGLFGPNCRCTVALRSKGSRVISPLRFVVEVHVPSKVSDRNLKPWPKSNRLPKKIAANKIYLVPSEVDGVLTKVIESVPYQTCKFIAPPGIVRSKGSGHLEDISLSPSISLASTELIGGVPTTSPLNLDNWGTLGIAFQDHTNSVNYGIINAHFASDQMVQPPHSPQISDLSNWRIGRAPSDKRFDGTVNNQGKNYYVDAALIELYGNRDLVLNLVQDFEDEGFLYANDYLNYFHDHSQRTDVGQKVFKFGARTSASTIVKERLGGYIDNPIDGSFGSGTGMAIRAVSNGGIEFTCPGDSGSALVAPIFDMDSSRERFLVVGLCFGGLDGQRQYVYACHFAAVIQALELKIPRELLRKDWGYSRP